jgi:tRNA A-37 threonylcarbamoyl transferase component Bud32
VVARLPANASRSAVSPGGLLRYLASAGVVDPAAVGDPTVRVTDLSRSHLVISVRFGDGRQLIVKRARPRPQEVVGNLRRELVAYHLATDIPGLAAAMPVCLHADPVLQVLVMRGVTPGTTLRDQVHPGRALPASGARLGQLVAGWHRGSRGLTPPTLPAERPWVLDILTPGCWRPPVTDALLVYGRIRRELRHHFAGLADVLEPSCLVHGDLKWDNCLVEGSDGVRVIDWEMAAVGDPAWDVAGILQDHLVFCRAVATPTEPANLQEQAREAAAEFLSTYLAAADVPNRASFGDRAARLTGARLVQSALEHAAAGPDQRLARLLVDDALGVLVDPGWLLGRRSAAR